MKKVLGYLLLGIISFSLHAQEISMSFPKFSGKSYDFIIFQGSEQKTIYQGVIPEGGKFTLSVPEEYKGYEGMSRWLITGTKEGGGLDMYIPGHDFSVSCEEDKPSEENIIYGNNNGNGALNKLYKEGEGIVLRYDLMLRATNLFNNNDKNYKVFVNEYNNQRKAYDNFQKELSQRGDYISDFVRIVNITQGIGTRLYDNEKYKGENIAGYIVNDMNFEYLYTSGHWWSVLNGWVGIHTRVLKNPNRFKEDFKRISKKLKSETMQKDFRNRVESFLKEEGHADYIRLIASTSQL